MARLSSAAQPVSLPGVSFALVSAASFALQGLFARLSYAAGASTPFVGFGRFTLTAVVLWVYALWRSRGGAFPVQLPGRTTLALLLLGSIGYFLGSLTYLGAVTTIPVSLAGLLLYTYPAIATVLAIRFGRERLSRGLTAGLVLALIGVAVTLGIPALAAAHHPDPRGVLLVLASAFLYSGYIIGSERTVQGIHAMLAMAYIASGAALSFGLLTLATRSFTPAVGPNGLGSIAGMAIVSRIVAAGGFLTALRRLGPARAATISTVEPPLTVLFAALILGERLEPAQLAGGLVILLGVLVIIRERRRVPDIRIECHAKFDLAHAWWYAAGAAYLPEREMMVSSGPIDE